MRLPIRKAIYYVLTTFLVAIIAALLVGPKTEIRIDCGDTRLSLLGIPVKYQRMEEPERSILLSPSSRNQPSPSRWVPVVAQEMSFNPEGAYRHWFRTSCAWAKESPDIFQTLRTDIGSCIEDAGGRRVAILKEYELLKCVDPETGIVRPGWKSNELVIRFCAEHGISVDVPQPLPASMKKL
jgi:hypothetical protein